MTESTDRGVLFDLDGTLLDSAPDLAGAINELRVDAGLEPMPQSELAPMCSYGTNGMLRTGLDLKPGDAGYQENYDVFTERYRARMTLETRPFDGVRDVIRAIVASGWRWGVVTNKLEPLAIEIMDAMAFDPAPVCIVGGGSTDKPKPDPAPLLLACERGRLDPARCIYVGDSERDMRAGNAAGMPTIGVGFGYIPVDDDYRTWPATRLVDTVAEMAAAIVELQAELIARDAGEPV